ncbi:M20/M25/M40 family metallo-hydrolase [Croceibacterium sp. LX-88]|uniref:M20/M25/M40 family metallo-hydrolase n=1 Tax=Croceibacterium selenioxidans TaxID=2838833 RepID=A0ABS5W9E3_9SPHN|nr:M20/M25/M40 family metallo-hydrolase [Croceibacterium selenioxidans]MBT2135024.1 M20/M25/M40 family metallo-hydrolase [Croceibacterium selenioxidans]
MRSIAAVLLLAVPVTAAAQSHPQAEAQALALSQETIALRSVQGEGNRTADVAQAFRKALLAGGWVDKDIEIVPVDDTAYLIATWPGSDPSLKPVLLSAHMDVVEAKPEDWERDPFTPVVENGYLYGRGASDTKFEASLAVASLIELRRQGFKPKRTIVIAYSGDEETTMKTSRMITDRFKDAELVINIDGASGTFSEETGKPLYWSWQGAEKTYIDFQLEVTNPGGHSSTPRPENAIAQLSEALARIGAYRFAPEVNDITRAYFEKASALQPEPELAAAMRAFAKDPNDAAALAILRNDPSMAGRIATTCVPTMVQGGHAPNALPQRATAVVNCRVFPGHSNPEIQAELERVAATPAVKFSDITGDTSTASPASPLKPEFISVFEKGARKAWGDVPIIPMQSSGASDSMWFRAVGVPSYGASASMSKDSDDFSHGLNERISLQNLGPGVTYYLSVMTDLASK